jgi:hypothetical protein
MKARFALGSIAACALSTGAVLAARPQEQPRPKAAAAQPAQTDKKARTLNIRYGSMNHDEASDTTDFKAAVITDVDEGTIFRADSIKVNNKKGAQSAAATGNLLVTDKQADVTGNDAVIYYAKSKRLVVLTKNIVIQVKPKSDQKDPTAQNGPAPVVLQGGAARIDEPKASDEDESAAGSRKYPTTITCDKVEYEYGKGKKHATLTGNFKAVQKMPNRTRTLYADHAEWFGPEDRLLLHGPVRWEDTKDDQKGSSPGDVTVFTKEGDERIQMPNGGVVEMKVPDEDEDEPAKSGTKPPAGKLEEKKPPKPGPDKKAA